MRIALAIILLQCSGAQERLWKRAAAKALAEAAAAAVQRGDLRASAKGGELRGGPAASRVSQPVLRELNVRNVLHIRYS